MASASQSLSRWSMNIAADFSTVPTTNSSIFFSIITKRRRFINSAQRNSSSSCSSSYTSNYRSGRKNLINSGFCCLKQTKVVYNAKNDFTSVSSDGVRTQKRQALSFKLWRKILFASKKVRSVILLNVITIVYASNIAVVKEVESIADPLAFSVVRFAVCAIPFIPFVVQARGDAHTRNAGIELGFWISLGYLFQALGLLTSDAGRASFISMLTVIVVPLLDGMLGAIVPTRTWFGAVMSVSGVGLLESSGSSPRVGDLLNFLSAVFFGVHMLRTERISRSTNKKNLLPLLGYEVCVIALFSAIGYFVEGWFCGIQDSDLSSWTWTLFWDWMISFPWIPALYTGIFSTGLCLWIEMAAMRDVSATETAIIYALEPVWGAGFAWCLLGERWGATGWLGAALVLGGSLTVQLFGSSSHSDGIEDEKRIKKGGHQLGLDNQNGSSISTGAVTSRKDVPNLLKE